MIHSDVIGNETARLDPIFQNDLTNFFTESNLCQSEKASLSLK